MFTFATDYFLLVFVSTIGVIQLSASLGGLKGLLVFKSPVVARPLGIILVVAAIVIFFATEDRILNDFKGGLDANTQALFFFLGVLAGGAVTFIGSSLINIRMNDADASPGSGFDALRDTNYLRALVLSLRYWTRNWRQQMRSYFSG